MTPDWVEAIGTVVAAIAALTAVWVAYRQLSNLNDSLRMSTLNVVLQLEVEMNARRAKVNEAATRVRLEAERTDTDGETLTILTDDMHSCLEGWLNSADRLAYCILKGYLKERDWRSEYRGYFADLITNHSEYFGVSTIYTNLLDLNNKWKRE